MGAKHHERPDDAENCVYSATRERKPRGRRGPVATYVSGLVPEENVDVLGFDSSGRETAEHEDMVAKRLTTSRSVRYFVKFSTSGHDIGHMFNPVGLYFNQAEVKRDQAKTGRARYEYKQVPESSFRHYLTFLQGRVESFLRTAERQVLDA